MQISKLKITNVLQEQLISYLTGSILFDYINISTETTILAIEEYYLRTNSQQLNLIIIKVVDSDLHIDVIGAGGGAGILGLNWGSEESFAKKAIKDLKDFCKTMGETLEVM